MKRFKRCFGNCTSTTGSVFICFSFSQPHQASEGLPWATEYHEKLGYSTAIQFCFFEEPSVWLRKLRQSPFRYEGAGLNRQRPGRKRKASFSVDLQKCAGLERGRSSAKWPLGPQACVIQCVCCATTAVPQRVQCYWQGNHYCFYSAMRVQIS